MTLSIVLSISLAATPVWGAWGSLAPAEDGAPATDAEGPPPEAVEAFFRGRDLYAKAQYEEALEAFLEADRLYPAPDLQFNIGLAHMRLEHWEQAISAFEIYLRTKENPPDRADVEARIAEAKRRLEEEEASPPPASLQPTGEADPSRDPAAPQRDTDPASQKTYQPFIITGGVLLGLGVAGAVAGAAGTGALIQDKNEEIDEIVNGGNPRGVTYADAVALEEDARELQTYQYVAIGVGAGVAVVGAALLGVGLKRRADARNATTALAPWWAPGRGGGLAIRGTF